jgi:HEAT repeat protein
MVMRTPGDEIITDDKKENEKVLRGLNILASTAISDKDPLARKYALYMLGTSGDSSYTDIFIQSFCDSEKAVRGQAAMSLAGIGIPVIPKVIPLLNDKEWKVRYRAAEVLGMIKSRDAVQPLIESLTDEKDHVRYMAAKSLGLIMDPAALEPLRNCRTDENPYVRKMVGRVIIEIEGENVSN